VRVLLGAVALLFIVAYPALVYFGLTRLGTARVAWLLLGMALVGGLLQLARNRQQPSLQLVATPLSVLTLVMLTLFFDDKRFLLALPVLINLVLFLGFGGSLRGELPLVERYARLQVDDLSAAEVRYCRRVTLVWSLFFVANGSTCAALAAIAPLEYWALYVGAVAYVLMGALGAGEYIYRKYRFGRFAEHPLDRVLRALLPQAPPADCR